MLPAGKCRQASRREESAAPSRSDRVRHLAVVAGAAFAAGLLVAAPTFAAGAGTMLISKSSAGRQANFGSGSPSVSADGRFVAFVSGASNLVAGDSNGDGTGNAGIDIFVRDRQSGTTTRVDVSSDGAQTSMFESSGAPSISADGRYVAFESLGANLVADDTNEASDVFVRDRQAGTTKRVSISTAGLEGNGASLRPSISADGRYVAFESDADDLVAGDSNGGVDVFVRDRLAGTTTRVGTAAMSPSISADGRYVAFQSGAGGLVPNDTNAKLDIFVRDLQAGTTIRVSISTRGRQGDDHSAYPSISADGRHVAFTSYATNLVANDTNDRADIFVRDLQAGRTRRVSVSSAGMQGHRGSMFPSISADGRIVAFQAYAGNLVANDTNARADVFVHDRVPPGG